MIDQGKKQQEKAHQMEHEARKMKYEAHRVENEALLLIKKGEDFLRKNKKKKKTTSKWHKAKNKLRLVTNKAKKGSKEATIVEMADLESNKNNDMFYNPMHSNNLDKKKKKEAKAVT